MTRLILTNGDTSVDLLNVIRPDDRIVPWRDCLHEGPLLPLQSKDDQAAFAAARADFLARRDWGERDDLLSEFKARDQLLNDHSDFEAIELWFEHDLYDQLQLIEILTRLYHHKRFDGVSLIQSNVYLGMQSPERLKTLEELEVQVGEQMMAIADLAWQTVSHDRPTNLYEFVQLKPAGFLFLAQALRRFLEELPGPDGLSRTERQMVYSLRRGVTKPGMLFGRCQAMEEAQFWGDWGFFHVLSGLQFCQEPLIQGLPGPFSARLFMDGESRKDFLQKELSLTAFGEAVINSRADHAAKNEINRFVGGTEIRPDNLWRYDREKGELLAPSA